MASREDRRFSRLVAYLLIMGSLVALCNAVVQPVSSQVFYTSTSTETNTATFFTVSEVTANLSVTVLTVYYTTSTSLFTMVNVQFTTLTSNITDIQIIQSPERVLSFRASQAQSLVHTSPSIQSRAAPANVYAILRYVEGGLVLQLITCFLVFVIIASMSVFLRRQKDR